MTIRKIYFIIILLVLAAATAANAGPGGGTWYANSPAGDAVTGAACVPGPTCTGTPLAKFVDSLPGVGLPGCTVDLVVPANNTCNANNLGQYIPIAQADTLTFPGSDYYVIGLKDFTQKMHTNLVKASKLRGYYQINATDVKLQTPHYLGPIILAAKNKPVRLKFINNLCLSNDALCNAGPNAGGQPNGKLFIPVDTTVMGAGTGPNGGVEIHTENRATIHLHGGLTPWVSDGTPHQWITPAGDPTSYKKGLSFQNVPDMIGNTTVFPAPPAINDGIGTFYYTNAQSSRLMFYHDHTYGITRLTVYAGQAAGYLLVDPQEEALITAGTLPNICPGGGAAVCANRYGIPLIIQDKSFVPDNIATQDTLWSTVNWGAPGDLWFPHVYEPAQSLTSPTGLNPLGRWDYGPWVWPPSPVTNPVLPQPSIVPESFMDTPIVNGVAYPFMTVDPRAYRFRILNAANDRTFNLQLYIADPAVIGAGAGKEVAMVPAIPRQLCTALVTTNCVCNAPTSAPVGCFPATWPTDGRDGGVPDPLYAGPQMVQIGTESGLLAAPVTIPNHPIGYDPATGNVDRHSLVLMPAERADVIIDFAGLAAGTKVILYNDAPAAFPGGDPRYDYYTGDPDQTLSGGAPSTVAGFGPNTRTIMQFVVSNVAPAAPFVVNSAALSAAFAASQPAPIVKEPTYPVASGGNAATTTYARLIDTSITVNGVVRPLRGKSINEGFDPIYGRIFAQLGTGDPSGLTASVPLDYVNPPTEIVNPGETQLWKVLHNGVDSHPIHFHLVNVQVINRIGFDGSIRPPESTEIGWKETVRMNPFEDIIVAFKTEVPPVPFVLPDSIRQLDPTMPVSIMNPLTNFGHEYAWHCHILGHEEFDLMRPLVLNLNGKSDILWRHGVSGLDYAWQMNGTIHTGGTSLPTIADINWQIVGVGDFNRDSQPDILWRNGLTGDVYLWYMDGLNYTNGVMIGNVPAPWQIAGVGDFDNDGKQDILWRNATTGDVYIWYMNGAVHTGGVMIGTIPTTWQIAGVGDFNHDGKPDILWRDNTGQNYVWYMNGAAHTGGSLLPNLADTNWQVVGVGDFNGDISPDILWRHAVTGADMVWLMNGVTQIGTVNLDTLADVNWKIQGAK